MLKGTTTVFGLMISMSLFSYSFSQTTTYKSTTNNQCTWNEETQVKDLCQEVSSSVEIKLNTTENRVFITRDGYTSEYEIENGVNSGGATQEYTLIYIDGTMWKMRVNQANQEIYIDMENSQYTDSITYKILN